MLQVKLWEGVVAAGEAVAELKTKAGERSAEVAATLRVEIDACYDVVIQKKLHSRLATENSLSCAVSLCPLSGPQLRIPPESAQ